MFWRQSGNERSHSLQTDLCSSLWWQHDPLASAHSHAQRDQWNIWLVFEEPTLWRGFWIRSNLNPEGRCADKHQNTGELHTGSQHTVMFCRVDSKMAALEINLMRSSPSGPGETSVMDSSITYPGIRRNVLFCCRNILNTSQTLETVTLLPLLFGASDQRKRFEWNETRVMPAGSFPRPFLSDRLRVSLNTNPWLVSGFKNVRLLISERRSYLWRCADASLPKCVTALANPTASHSEWNDT